MSFVHEYIPESERSFFQKYDLPIWSSGAWTVDRERDVYLIYIENGTRDGIWQTYCLIFKGEKIMIDIERKTASKTTGEKTTFFPQINIVTIHAPKKLKPYCDEIIELIKEAFTEELSSPLRSDPFIEYKELKILSMAQPTFGYREAFPHDVLIRVEHYTRDIMLIIGLALSEDDIRRQLADVERMCKDDPNADLGSLMHKKYYWGVHDINEWYKVWSDEPPDWIYDRDTGELYAPKG